MSGYLEKLRNIVLNELSVGGKNLDGDDSSDDGNENFVDNSKEETPESNDGDENFMNDDDDGDDSSDDESSSDTGDENFVDDDGDDSSDDGNENFMNDDDGDESSEESDESSDGGDDSSGDESSSDDGNENFMNDDDGDDSSGESEENDESSDDSEDSEEGYDLEKIENELFSSLTPEQIAIKNHELKNNFIELYSIIGTTLVRINDISKSNENINVLKFITEKLLELREMIDFNITVSYQTRTYIENNIIYQQCIATLNAISEIIDQIPKLDNKEFDSDDETEDNKNGYPVENDDESSEILNVSDTSVATIKDESYDYSSDYNDLF